MKVSNILICLCICVLTVLCQQADKTKNDKDVVLTENIIYYKRGNIYPHEADILVKSGISFSPLESVTKHLDQTYNILGRLLNEWTDRQRASLQVNEPIEHYPKYTAPYAEHTFTLRKARLTCESFGMRLVAPKNVSELTEVQSWALKHTPWQSEGMKIWIDSEYQTVDQIWVNPITKDSITDIYRGVPGPWKPWNMDDFTRPPSLEVRTGKLWFEHTPNLGHSMDSNARPAGVGKSPKCYVVCQSTGVKDNIVNIQGTVKDFRDVYVHENSRIPKMAIKETRELIKKLANETKRLFKDLFEKYELRRFFGMYFDSENTGTVNGLNKTFQIKLPGANHGTSHSFLPVMRSKREADYARTTAVGIGRFIPFFGNVALLIDDILREQEKAEFEQTTKEALFELYRTADGASKEIAGIKFGCTQLEKRIQQNEIDVAISINQISEAMLYMELNGRLDIIVTNSLALYSDYMQVLRNLEDWMAMLRKGSTPPELFTGLQLDSVREVLSNMNLEAKWQFQQGKSIVLPDPVNPSGLTIISNIKATGKAWNLYEVIAIPQWRHSKLFRQRLGKYKYIAVDPYFTKYSNIGELNFYMCLNQACNINGPIRSLSNAECGRSELIGQKELTETCTWEEIVPTPSNYFEGVSGGLVFSLRDQSIEVTMSCPHNNADVPHKKRIEKSGIMFIPSGYQVTTPDGLSYYGNPNAGFDENDIRDLDIREIHETDIFDLVLDELINATESGKMLLFFASHRDLLIACVCLLFVIPMVVLILFKLVRFYKKKAKSNKNQVIRVEEMDNKKNHRIEDLDSSDCSKC